MRISIHSIATAVAIAMLASGCGMLGTKTFKEFNINEGTSVSIDATQRVILVKDSGSTKTVCAEPSPDAIVAAAAQMAAKADSGTGAKGDASAGFSQSASSIGVRTATIQLLRDGYFRACEASMNALLDADGYQAILAGITPVMVGLVAIDALTQMPAPNVYVGAAGNASTTSGGTTTTTTATGNPAPATPAKADQSDVANQVVSIVEKVLASHDARMKVMYKILYGYEEE